MPRMVGLTSGESHQASRGLHLSDASDHGLLLLKFGKMHVRARVAVGYIGRILQLDDSAAERNGHRAGAIGCVQLLENVLHANLHGLFR
jgi:hypothetical protein